MFCIFLATVDFPTMRKGGLLSKREIAQSRA